MSHRWAVKDHINKRGLKIKEPIFSSNDLRRFNSILIIWCILCVLISLSIDHFKISTFGCDVCNQFTAYLPFIDYAAQGTLFPELTRSLWISFLVTLPFALVYLLMRVKTSPKNSIDWTAPILLLFLSIGYFVLLMVEGNQEPDLSGFYTRMFSASKIGNILISSSLFISLVSGLFFLIDKVLSKLNPSNSGE